jgi:hypothetical protein
LFGQQLRLHDFHSPGLGELKRAYANASEEVEDVARLALIPPTQELDLGAEGLQSLARLQDLRLQASVRECERSQMVEEDPHTPFIE